MKKFTIILFALVAINSAIAQGCLPEGIYFWTQAEIDSFQINYPNCTEIEGSVIIIGNDITNLNGLSVLTSITGNLGIIENSSLNVLTGLDNVTSIGGSLNIKHNPVLTGLTGLENVTSIADICIADNNSLNSLTGLANVSSIEGFLHIGEWSVGGNPGLTNLEGLENVTYIGGDVYINYNDSLTDLVIGANVALTNLTGLESIASIGGDLGISIPITNLSGLDNLETIGGDLIINQCNALDNLMALVNLTSIGEHLNIQSNSVLTNLTGMENVTSIGGSIWIRYNYAMNSLSGLENLSVIGGSIEINSNNSLTNLSGLGNIASESISNLWIYENASLSTCDVQSICAYIVNPNGIMEIHDNAPGCNSQEEVEAACLTTVEEIKTGNELTIIPNPSNDNITISSYAITGNTQLSIVNVSGEKVIERQLIENETQLDISALPRGVYFVRLQNEKIVEIGKMVKE
jgi:hypothetical protein